MGGERRKWNINRWLWMSLELGKRLVTIEITQDNFPQKNLTLLELCYRLYLFIKNAKLAVSHTKNTQTTDLSDWIAQQKRVGLPCEIRRFESKHCTQLCMEKNV